MRNNHSSDVTEVMGHGADVTEVMDTSKKRDSAATEVMGSAVTELMGAGGASAQATQSGGFIHAGSMIGSGYVLTDVISDTSGEAVIYKCVKDGKNFAAKIYFPSHQPKEEIISSIKSIKSAHVISIIEDGILGRRYFEIQPFYCEGNLLDCIQSLSKEFILKTVVQDVNEGLKAIHPCGIIHRDIKPSNIFFADDKKNVVIGDFGISSMLGTDISIIKTSTNRTVAYCDNESALGIWSKESDYYSFGITLLHLLTGKNPFDGMNETQIALENARHRLNVPDSLGERACRLIRGLTIKSRHNRWGYEQVRDWVNGKAVEVKDSEQDVFVSEAYEVTKSLKVYGARELALALADNWNLAKDQMRKGLITDYLRRNSGIFGQAFVAECIDCVQEKNADLGLLKLIHLLARDDKRLFWHGKTYSSLKDLHDEIVEHYLKNPKVSGELEALVRSGALLYYFGYIKNSQEGIDDRILSEVKALAGVSDSEQMFFQLICLLNSNTPIYWRGKTYAHLIAIRDGIDAFLPQIDSDIQAFLSSAALINYLKTDTYKDNASLLSAIDKLLKSADDTDILYFRLYFLLSGKCVFKYANQQFTAADDFITYVCGLGERIEDTATEIMENQAIKKYFAAWMIDLGFSDAVSRQANFLSPQKNYAKK